MGRYRQTDTKGNLTFGKYKGQNAVELVKTDKGLAYIEYMEREHDIYFGNFVHQEMNLIYKTKRWRKFKEILIENFKSEDAFEKFIENEKIAVAVFESMDFANNMFKMNRETLNSDYDEKYHTVNLKEL